MFPPWTRLLTIFLAAGSLTLLAVDRLNGAFSFWRRSIPINFASAENNASAMLRLHLETALDDQRMFPSQIRLSSGRGDLFSYTPRVVSLSMAGGRGLFTIQNSRTLLVAWPGIPGATAAKGNGILTFPRLLPASVFRGCLYSSHR
jgi:hypothetical protein